MSALQKAKTSSIHALSNNWSEVQGYYRFLGNQRVTERIIIDKIVKKTGQRVQNKRILAIADSTEINCEGHINRLQGKAQLGMLSNNKTYGFHVHAIYCVDEVTGFPLGLGGIRQWNRGSVPIGHTRKKRFITEKEVDKWYSDNLQARDKTLSQAAHICFVMDRDGDIYEVLEALPSERADVVVRCHHDRWVIPNGKDERTKLHKQLSTQRIKGNITFQLQSRNRRGQTVKASVRYCKITIPKPSGKCLPDTKENIELWAIELREKACRKAENQVLWRILTSVPTESFEQACEVIETYRKRWQIEEFFRLIKKESFNIEASELENGYKLRKLSLFVMEAAVKIAQLKAVRSKESSIKTSSVFSKKEIACLQLLNRKYKGSTAKQSNPFNPDSLSWASWVIARLGGWKGYMSQAPPGSITFKRGLERFDDIFIGFLITKYTYV